MKVKIVGLPVANNGLNILWGGQANKISDNPFDGGTTLLTGNSHQEQNNGLSGIGVNTNGQNIEAEGGETITTTQEGDKVVHGNLVIPGTNTKFKKASKDLAKLENKASRQQDKATNLLDDADPDDNHEKLTFNSGMLKEKGAQMKQKALADQKDFLSSLQDAILQTADKHSIDPQSLAKGEIKKAKTGTTIKIAANGVTLKDKFEKTRQDAIAELQKLYPNSKVDIQQLGNRDIATQRGLHGSGASQTDASLHNFAGANDLIPIVDGVPLDKKTDLGVYKNTIQKAAKQNGLFHIGDWDPGHISAVQEGQGRVYENLIKKYPEVKNDPTYINSINYLQNLSKTGKFSKSELNSYEQLTGNKSGITPITPDYKGAASTLPQGTIGEWPNIHSRNPEQTIPTDRGITPIIPHTQPIPVPGITQESNTTDKPFDFTGGQRYPLTTNQKGLSFEQYAPALYAFASNAEQPVKAQLYNPDLLTPYNVSFQDKLNDNQSSFNALRSSLSDNPQALETIAGQKYNADNSVRGDEFRTNQGIYNNVVNSNTQTLNDAKLKNLGILDQQAQRQSTARSITKAQNEGVLNDISDKILENNLNNKKLMAAESMTAARFVTNADGTVSMVREFTGNPFDTNLIVNGKEYSLVNKNGTNQGSTKEETDTQRNSTGMPIKSTTKVVNVTPKGAKNGMSIQSMVNKKFGRAKQ